MLKKERQKTTSRNKLEDTGTTKTLLVSRRVRTGKWVKEKRHVLKVIDRSNMGRSESDSSSEGSARNE